MTRKKDYASCQIFVRGTGRQFLAELVAVTLGAQVDDHYSVRAGRMVFDTRPNPDAGLADDFIGWPLKIDAEADEDGPSLVEPVSHLLTATWDRGYDAVAACDFESELPDLGGLSRYH
ncbi:hypothetical protein LO771_24395 [Streptacidiphilus sp. ASG 303]|uniref:hypothetical protein n=1 Tax=Streptacidiphilus sp. ASG 303 TaxID=2896847 RepID=UPI001E39FB86|nr:hypothetical protein [Streptacidiphilus sp. ASG 303]MCD0485438.1 hypothetical protein [Streptacidiphilus sp. ASG 303]